MFHVRVITSIAANKYDEIQILFISSSAQFGDTVCKNSCVRQLDFRSTQFFQE